MNSIQAPSTERRTHLRQEDSTVVIPHGIDSLSAFRDWSHSEAFPDDVTITWFDGEIIIDMSPERFDSHNSIKTEFTRVIANLNVQHHLGRVCSDRFRFVNAEANLSTEPDLLFVSRKSLRRKLAIFVPSSDGRDAIEVSGSPDMVLEVGSPGSRVKDFERLRKAYFDAGVREYWLVDAFSEKAEFTIRVPGTEGFVRPERIAAWQGSEVFGRQFRLVRKKIDRSEWVWRVESRPL